MKYALLITLFALAASCNNSGIKNNESENPDSTLYEKLTIGISEKTYTHLMPSDQDTIENLGFEINGIFTPDDSLAGVMLNGPTRLPSEISTKLSADIDVFKRAYALKYGEPTITNKKPSIIDTSVAKDFIVYEWELPTKIVQIGMTSMEGSYYAFMKIYNNRLLQKTIQKVELNKKEQAKKDSEKF